MRGEVLELGALLELFDDLAGLVFLLDEDVTGLVFLAGVGGGKKEGSTSQLPEQSSPVGYWTAGFLG